MPERPVVAVSNDPRLRKIKEKYEQFEQMKNSRKIQIVSDVVMSMSTNEPIVSPMKNNICEAITKSGKRCSFKAMCNGKCKKHAK